MAKLLGTTEFQECWRYLIFLIEENPVQGFHCASSKIKFELQRLHEDDGILAELTVTYEQAAVDTIPRVDSTYVTVSLAHST